jgi:hypothetical protein
MFGGVKPDDALRPRLLAIKMTIVTNDPGTGQQVILGYGGRRWDVSHRSWRALPSIPFKDSTNCCHGIGAAIGRLIKQLEPKLTGMRSSPEAY